MELALLLVILVIAELVVSVWILARHKAWNKRVSRLERNARKMAEVLADMASDKDDGISNDSSVEQDLASLVASATPEDIEQAQRYWLLSVYLRISSG